MKMKNKKAGQIEAKEQHLAQRSAIKARRRHGPVLGRSEATKVEKQTFLIVCNGENTEPSYFRQFKLTTATIKTDGQGHNTITLVNYALGLKQKNNFDQVWVVFDRDDFPAEDFNNAIAIAEANDIRVAYSNQAFEYWLILHFHDHQGGGMDRKDYGKIINSHLKPLGAAYDNKGSKLISEEFFEILNSNEGRTRKSRVENALLRAKRNYREVI